MWRNNQGQRRGAMGHEQNNCLHLVPNESYVENELAIGEVARLSSCRRYLCFCAFLVFLCKSIDRSVRLLWLSRKSAAMLLAPTKCWLSVSTKPMARELDYANAFAVPNLQSCIHDVLF